jgi:ferrous iron transport protein B
VAEEVGATASVYAGLRAGFTQGRPQAYAYLLFILLYMPCVAAFAAMTKEMGLRYSMLSVTYLTVVAWSVATLFYQFTVEGSALWIGVAGGMIGLTVVAFWLVGRRSQPLETRLSRVAEGSARC